MNDKSKKHIDKFIDWIGKNQFQFIAFSIIILMITFWLLPYFLTHFDWGYSFDENSAQIGDSIGGITGPIIALIASILTFFAFWVQYKANLQQKKDLKIERFENRFFEMIRLHKENVNEISIGGHEYLIEEGSGRRDITPRHSAVHNINQYKGPISKTKISVEIAGRNAINDINTEIRACYEICFDFLKKEKFVSNEVALSNDEKKRYVFKIAFRFIFLGINSDNFLFADRNIDKDEKFVMKCRERLKYVQLLHQNNIAFVALENSENKVNLLLKYPPFEGHASKLGHYFRHLYQSVKYVVKQDENFISNDEKREYLVLLRSQLSNQEQLLLYLNYLAGFGRKWENNENSFLVNYRMIHNMPVLEAQYCINPLWEFKTQWKDLEQKGEKLFEQQHDPE